MVVEEVEVDREEFVTHFHRSNVCCIVDKRLWQIRLCGIESWRFPLICLERCKTS